jgi:hypothetical protein
MKMIKVIGVFGVMLLAGCEQYVANPKDLSEKMDKCDSVGMSTILLITDSVSGDVKVKCVEKWK